MAVAGAGAGAEIKAKVGAGAENKSFRLRNTEKTHLKFNQKEESTMQLSAILLYIPTVHTVQN